MVAAESIHAANFARWTFAESKRILWNRFVHRSSVSLESVSDKSWEICPSDATIAPPAYSLPGQLDRVTGWTFADERPGREMGGGEKVNGPTRVHLIKDVWLIDGSLYMDDAYLWLTLRSGFRPLSRVEREIDHVALFCTPMGNKYFGQWLMDDCVTYTLAKDEGFPVTTNQPVYAHTQGFEDWLDMKPARLGNAFFRELVIYDDVGQDRSKHLCFRGLGDKILSRIKIDKHPGVFYPKRFGRYKTLAAERNRNRGVSASSARLSYRRSPKGRCPGYRRGLRGRANSDRSRGQRLDERHTAPSAGRIRVDLAAAGSLRRSI
jgi:hypothetical protein